MNNWLREYKLHIYVPENWQSFRYLDNKGYAIPTQKGEMKEITLVDPLRCTFSVRKTALRDSNLGIITIYNLSPDLESQIMVDGAEVVLEAGYEGNTSIIFAGSIIQPKRGKEDGTDYYLKLICLDGDSYLNLAFSSGVLEKNQNWRQLAQQTLRSSTFNLGDITVRDLEDIPVESTVDSSTPKIERPKVVFGRTSKIINQIARMGNSSSYVDNGELKFFVIDDEPNLADAWEINEETGMIGNPEQSSYQVTVRTLLNPRIRIGDYIHLNNQTVSVEEFTSIGSLPFELSSDGYYKVIEISYSGDNRGNNWYSTIKAITKDGKIPSMLSDKQGNLIV